MKPLFIIAALAFAVSAAPARADNATQGDVFPLKCTTVYEANVDPMLGWGAAPFGHTHGFVGNRAVVTKQQNVTLKDLLDSNDSSCNLQSWKSLAWAPTVVKEGVSYAPTDFTTYYLKPATVPRLNVPPNGLRWVVGDPHNTVAAYGVGKWLCVGESTTINRKTIPTDCGGAAFGVTSYSGGCWDAKNYGPGLGGVGGPSNGRDHVEINCTAGEEPIPTLLNTWHYPAAAVGGRLSSDDPMAAPGASWHFDYVLAWGFGTDGTLALPKILDTCFNQDIVTPPGRLQCNVVPRNDGSGKDKVVRNDNGAFVTD